MAELNTDELTMMIALGCSAEQAHVEYASIEAFLILRDHPIPVGLAVVQADNVNVRAAPSTAAKVLRQHKKGDMLQVWGDAGPRLVAWWASRRLDCGEPAEG